MKRIENDRVELPELRERMNRCGAKGVPFLFAVDFEMTEGILIEHPLEQDRILFRTPLGANFSPKTEGGALPELHSFPESYERYRRRFDQVVAAIRRGDSYLVNLTLKTPISTPLTLQEIAFQSRSPYLLYLPERFLSFSPERFVSIHEGEITTHPMKGTIDASRPDAEQQLLSNPKEQAEHSTIVDLLRNDLSQVAERVEVKRFRYTERIETPQREILQVSSEIRGRLLSEPLDRLGDLLLALLPAGSVSGAPKQSTLEIIRRAEEEPRGFYCGIFGYFDGRSLDSGVLIRYIEQEGDALFFRSGGGITAGSDPESEYQEVTEKIYLPL